MGELSCVWNTVLPNFVRAVVVHRDAVFVLDVITRQHAGELSPLRYCCLLATNKAVLVAA